MTTDRPAVRVVRTRTRPTASQAQGNVVPFPNGEVPVQADDDPVSRAVRELNRRYAFITIGGKRRILEETEDEDQGFVLLEPETFHELHASRVIDPDDPKSPQVTREWIKHADRRTLRGITFAPGRSTPRFYNTWRGFAVAPDPTGNCELFLEHLRVNVAQDNEQYYRWIFGWFAQMIQQPEIKPGTSLALRGPQGTGKTIIGDTFHRICPSHYILLDQAGQLTGRFSGHLDSKLLIHADEAFFAGSKAEIGRLKSIVTAGRLAVERKGQDIITVPNFARLLITSNEDWIVPAAFEERRFAVFDMGERNIQDHRFFGAMTHQLDHEGGLGRLLHDLQTFDLPTVDMRRIPQTAALIDQKIRSLDHIDAFVYARLCEGSILPDAAGWSVPVRRDYLHKALRDFARGRHVGTHVPTEEELGTRLRALFPGTRDRRPRDNGRRPRCWGLPNYAECCARFEQVSGIPIEQAEGVDGPAAPGITNMSRYATGEPWQAPQE